MSDPCTKFSSCRSEVSKSVSFGYGSLVAFQHCTLNADEDLAEKKRSRLSSTCQWAVGTAVVIIIAVITMIRLYQGKSAMGVPGLPSSGK